STTARATGCSDLASTAAAYRTTSRDDAAPTGATLKTWSSRRVSVPVLSNAITRTDARCSRGAPPLMSPPLRAAADNAATIDTGVEMTNAHGHEMTSSTRAR